MGYRGRKPIKIEIYGELLTRKEVAEKYELTYGMVTSRLKRGITGTDLIKPFRSSEVTNRSIEKVSIFGEMLTFSQIEDKYGVDRKIARNRYSYGIRGKELTSNENLSLGRKNTIKIDYFGEDLSVREIASTTRCDPSTIRARLKKGLTGWDLFKPRLVKCDAQCVACQKPFPIGKGKPQKYCSRKCAHTALITTASKHCVKCGSEFKARNASKKESEQVYCSRECAYSDIDKWSAFVKPPFTSLPDYTMVKPCKACGKLHPNIRRSWCDNDCRMELERRRYYDNKPKAHPRKCKECDLLFTPLGSVGAKFCTNLCCTRHQRRIQKGKRKARKKGSNYESIHPFDIFKRDRWICQMCGVATPRRLRGSMEDNAPELDHVIPLAKGGEHTRENTQCLCRLCNRLKSDKIIPKEQYANFVEHRVGA